MKLFIEYEKDEKPSNFLLADAIYKICTTDEIYGYSAYTIASMLMDQNTLDNYKNYKQNQHLNTKGE